MSNREIEKAFDVLHEIVADLRKERDLYRAGLESIVRRDLSDSDAKILASLYLGKVEVVI